MSARSRWIILTLALVGLGFASYSGWVHYKLLTDATYTSPCDLNATFNCSQVYLSRYGSVAGVPVALGGVFWFGLVALVAWFSAAGPAVPADRQPGGAYLFAIATVGLAVILYLGYSSWVVLRTACVLCLGTYASVVGIFVASGVSSSMSVSQLPGRFIRDFGAALKRPLVVVLGLALLGGTGYAAAVFPKEGTRPQAQAVPLSEQLANDFAAAWAAQPRVDLGVPADGAKVVIVKFNDYQCPGFAKTNPGAVKYVVKDWPWNARCNFNLPAGQEMHPGACEGAAAVRIARDRGAAKEAEMQDWLYANQPTMTPATVRTAAERILGIKDFDVEYAKKLPDIRKDVADGAALHIQSTPTLFINGVRIEQLMPPQYFELAIQLELKKASGK
jgi:uncharacterized membrane protein